MNRPKILSVPLISAILAVGILPASAQLSLNLSSKIAYRQLKDGVKFKGGTFDIALADGAVDSIYFCNDPFYFPPSPAGLCSPGTSGFLSEGSINSETVQRPYLVINSLSPAAFIEPFQPDFVALTAAPASLLPRPLAGFTDGSASIFYNLHTTDIREYKITNYSLSRQYSKREGLKFKSEIVPGVYQYVFPGIVPVGTDYMFRPAPISAVIHPMVEGFAEVNNTEQGVRFTAINGTFKWNQGFVEMSYLRPNTIRWAGFTPDTVFAAVDSLYFSMRVLLDGTDPENSGLVPTVSVFPAFDNGNETRVLLESPYRSFITIPPIFPSGLRSMMELQLLRNFQTGGVTYDRSTRKFQLPVIVVNRYTEYVSLDLSGNLGNNILADSDNDGYNNLNEWILGSDGSNSLSIPAAPVPAPYQAVDIFGVPTADGSYFGFNVNVQVATVPKVTYILQRSKDQGKTWQRFKSDNNWDVQRTTFLSRNVPITQLQVRSKQLVSPITPTTPNYFTQPVGTLSHIYRVKIVLKK